MQLTSISGVINTSISTTIGSVAMPASQYAKAMLIQTRSGNPFRICQGSGISEPYFSVGSGEKVQEYLSGRAGGRIMWVRAEVGVDVLEILLFNA